MKEITKKHGKLIEYLHPKVYYPNGEVRRIIIGIDGSNGAGKSTLSSFISWQFTIPVVHLDLFLFLSEDDYYSSLNIEHLGDLINHQHNRPIIIEGIFLLEVLETFNIEPDILIYASGYEGAGEVEGLKKYRNKYNPKKKAGFVWK